MSEQKYKIIALDVDGTLVNSQGKLNEADKEALLCVQRELDIRLIIASGRPLAGLQSLARELDLAKYGGYLLPYNGGEIIDVATGKVLYQNLFPRDCVADLYKIAQENKLNILSYTATHILSENVADPYLQMEVEITSMPTQEVNSFVEDIPTDLPKCLMVGPAEEVASIEPLVQAKFGEKIGVFRSNPCFLELVPKDINKAASLDRLLGSIGLSSAELIAFGDSYNDMEMISYAQMGVAMGNACDELKGLAQELTKTNDEAGIAYFINKHLLLTEEN